MYAISLTHTAEKQLGKLPKKAQRSIIGALDALADNPFVGKPLQGDLKGLWSMRIWPYRVIYVIEKDVLRIVVLALKHRQSAYKG